MDAFWIVAAFAAIFALFASLRLALPSGIELPANPLLRFATHPNWLVPYILLMGLVVGLMITGDLSPWPQEVMTQFAAEYGSWAGVTMFIVVITILLWLLWIPASLAQKFAKTDGTVEPRGIHLLNFGFGLTFLVLVAIFAGRG